jgi:transposase-like protein
MRYTQTEKMEIIRLVEESDLPVKRTLEELDVPRSTFYRWYERYQAAGYEGLADRQPGVSSGIVFRTRCVNTWSRWPWNVPTSRRVS